MVYMLALVNNEKENGNTFRVCDWLLFLFTIITLRSLATCDDLMTEVTPKLWQICDELINLWFIENWASGYSGTPMIFQPTKLPVLSGWHRNFTLHPLAGHKFIITSW